MCGKKIVNNLNRVAKKLLEEGALKIRNPTAKNPLKVLAIIEIQKCADDVW